jgi:2-amino-4-hydroxy-6-hydroxymethyldihydropteridine diphosphokinase
VIIVALGANLPSQIGPPENTIRAALRALSNEDIKIEAISRMYKSLAWPDASDPPFVNAVARISTKLSPRELLSEMHETEASFGRRRSVDSAPRNAPRTLDLDLIDYNGLVQNGPPILPHPRMDVRAFVLFPLRDVAPDWRHPKSGCSISELIASLDPAAEIPQAL